MRTAERPERSYQNPFAINAGDYRGKSGDEFSGNGAPSLSISSSTSAASASRSPEQGGEAVPDGTARVDFLPRSCMSSIAVLEACC